MDARLPFLVVSSLSLVGCVVDTVRARAAADFQCPEESIEVTQLPGHGFGASGCGHRGTYVCSNGICVLNSHSDSRPAYTSVAPPPPPAEVAKPAAPSGDAADSKGNVAHHGVAFELPSGFWRDDDAKGEVYRDGKRHHAVRLVIESSPGTEADWIAAKYPSAKTWTAKINGADVTFATQMGKSLRVTVAVLAASGKLYELACTSDDLTTEKTDEVCTKILRSFRLKPPAEGLPGE